MKELTMVQQIITYAEGKTDVEVCTRQIQEWNQDNIQSAMQAVSQNAFDDLAEILKHGRKMRKAIVGLPKSDTELFMYECGISNGVQKVLEEIHRLYMDQQDNRDFLNLLERKHVWDILVYLYQNPNARHNIIAENVNIKPNHLSEILLLLREAGFVEREGNHKSTKYYLTRIGRQTYKIYATQKAGSDDYMDIIGDIREIPDEKEYIQIVDKRYYEKERFTETCRRTLKGEDRYGDAKWKEHFRIDSEAANRWNAVAGIGIG
ncbi:MAG: Rrf2 family transcriptional regulator [Blautia sp.]|nr:Rrf2 family transcriptional regulator [Blautia sp.]